jgi:hypothetical protein
MSKTMEVSNETPVEVSRVAARLLPFHAEEPDVWFVSAPTGYYSYVLGLPKQAY